MGYRDELAAARRRIQQLESQLAELRGEVSGESPDEIEPSQPSFALLKRLREELERRKELERQVAELTERAARSTSAKERVQWQQTEAELEERVSELQMQQQVRQQAYEQRIAELEREVARPPSLWEHNRAPDGSRRPEGAEVLCPNCLSFGDRVPLTPAPRSSVPEGWARTPHAAVVCPRCLLFALRRA